MKYNITELEKKPEMVELKKNQPVRDTKGDLYYFLEQNGNYTTCFDEYGNKKTFFMEPFFAESMCPERYAIHNWNAKISIPKKLYFMEPVVSAFPPLYK